MTVKAEALAAPGGAGAARPATAAAPRIPRGKLIAYGIGGAGVTLMGSAVQTLVPPIFNVGFGLNAGGVALALAAPRLWELVFNPFIGSTSDRFSRAGRRRRPFLLCGGLAAAVMFAALWWAPREMAAPYTYAWLAAVLLVFHTAVSTYSIPYLAVGYDLSSDYHERTRIAGFRTACTFIARPLLAWLLPLCHLAVFASAVDGARWVGLGTALLIAACCLTPIFVAVEGTGTVATSPEPARGDHWFRDFLEAFTNRPFALLMICSVLKSAALAFTTSLGLYVLTYYAFRGEWQKGAAIAAVIASGYHLACVGFAPGMVWLARRVGKKAAMLLGLACAITGTLLKWPLYGPDPGWLLALIPLFMAPGAAGVDLVHGSMLADVCDHDELAAGRRRSGLFAGAAAWVGKAGASIALVFSGLLLNWSGFDPRLPVQSDATLESMRISISVLPALLLALAALCVAWYPLTKPAVLAIQERLTARRAGEAANVAPASRLPTERE